MSTGDQTQYIRSKMAERGSERGVSFMRDGFDRWAESETPARSGQMEKIPAETQMANYGGAMSLSRAKKLQMSIHGGADPLAIAKKAVAEAQKLINMWRSVSTWLDSLKTELEDEVIDNPAAPPSYKNVANNLLSALNSLKGMQTILDGVASAASLVGLGRKGARLHGGAFSLADIGTHAAKIASVYGWLRDNKPGIVGVLGLKALQPIGNQVLEAITPIFTAIGLGRSVGGRKCCCDDYSGGAVSSRPVGGRSSFPPLPSGTKMLGGRSYGGAKQYGMMEAPPMREIMGGKKPSARGEVVKRVMREQGLSLPQASKYVKDYGLY